MAEQSSQPMTAAIRHFTPRQENHHQRFDPSTGDLSNSREKFEMTSNQQKLAEALRAFITGMEARNQSNLSIECPHAQVPPIHVSPEPQSIAPTVSSLIQKPTQSPSPNSPEIARPEKIMIPQHFDLPAEPSPAVIKTQPTRGDTRIIILRH